jgi:hypothetical protein
VPGGWTSRPRDSREHAAPAERVDDQGGGQLAPVGAHGEPFAAFDGRCLELDIGRLRAQESAQLAVIEGRERPWQAPPERLQRRVEDEVLKGLADRALQAQRVQPRGGRGACARLALADLVAIDHEHSRARAGELAAYRQSREARAAHQDVEVALQRRALDAAFRGSNRHERAILGR